MAQRDLSLAVRMYADSARFVAGLVHGERGVKQFGANVRREFAALAQDLQSVQGRLAALGVGVGGVAVLAQSAKMDKSLDQMGLSAGLSREQVAGLRGELHDMAAQTGQDVDILRGSMNTAVAAGLELREAVNATQASNIAMAVTGAAADGLTNSLTVAATAFNFDLTKPGEALLILDKMTMGGRKGKAELENLSNIFSRVGVGAASGGFGFESALGFVEGLSKIESQPERLATLAESTMRLFNTVEYMRNASRNTGIKFYDAQGNQRDPLAILRDMKRQYGEIKTMKERMLWIDRAFGKTDRDTQKGLMTLFGGDMLDKVDEFTGAIKRAGGTLNSDLEAALANSINQTGRLKAVLRRAADDFAKPINDAIEHAIKFGLDKPEKGGMGLGGKELILGGAGLAAGGVLAARYGGPALTAWAKRLGGTATGVAEGKALEAAAGVTPVFVVNWPTGLGGSPAMPGLPGGLPGGGRPPAVPKTAGGLKSLVALAGGLDLAAWGAMGARGVALAAGSAGVAATAGYAAGTYVVNPIINAITSLATGRDETLGGLIYDKLHAPQQQVRSHLEIKVVEGRVQSVRAKTSGPAASVDIDTGHTMVMP